MPKLVGYASRRSGLMGLGAVPDDQVPIQVGNLAKNDPIFSTASSMASAVMLKMAAVPKAQRLSEMVKTLDNAEHGLGESARADFLRRVARSPANKVDQAMFDAIRIALGDLLVRKSLALGRRAVSGLGQTIAEASGRTSQGVNDANAIYCTYATGTVAMVGGVMDQLGITGTGSGKTTTTGTAGALTSSATTAAATGGCGAGRLLLQQQHAESMARISQSGAGQALAAQAAQEARMMRYLMFGGGGLIVLVVAVAVLKK